MLYIFNSVMFMRVSVIVIVVMIMVVLVVMLMMMIMIVMIVNVFFRAVYQNRNMCAAYSAFFASFGHIFNIVKAQGIQEEPK